MWNGKIGVIGVGNMAKAIVEGALRGGFSPEDFLLLEHAPEKGNVRAWAQEKGLGCTEDRDKLLAGSELVLLAVKPVILKEIGGDIAPGLRGRAVASIIAGWTTDMLAEAFPGARILRAAPNTPMQVGLGYTALSGAHTLNENEYIRAERLFAASGEVESLPERLMDIACVVAGCTPAYACMFIDALADAGVRAGLPRKTAIRMAAAAVQGTGGMVLRTGEHPDALKDAVCSPGGSTIEGVYALEKGGLRGSLMDAVQASYEKFLPTGKKG